MKGYPDRYLCGIEHQCSLLSCCVLTREGGHDEGFLFTSRGSDRAVGDRVWRRRRFYRARSLSTTSGSVPSGSTPGGSRGGSGTPTRTRTGARTSTRTGPRRDTGTGASTSADSTCYYRPPSWGQRSWPGD